MILYFNFFLKEKFKNVEVNRMRNGYIIATLTSVDIQEIVKIGGRVTEIDELFIEKFLKLVLLEKLKKNYLL